MYVIKYTKHSQELLEMTAKEYRDLNKSGDHYVPVSAQQAHKYVKDGGLHMTTLWVDNGKIRKA